MTLSPDEQRDLGEINRILSRDRELFELAQLFTEPPPSHPPTVRPVGHPGSVVAVLAAILTFGTGCVIGSAGGPGPITAGTLLVLCSAAIVVAVLLHNRPRLVR